MQQKVIYVVALFLEALLTAAGADIHHWYGTGMFGVGVALLVNLGRWDARRNRHD